MADPDPIRRARDQLAHLRTRLADPATASGDAELQEQVARIPLLPLRDEAWTELAGWLASRGCQDAAQDAARRISSGSLQVRGLLAAGLLDEARGLALSLATPQGRAQALRQVGEAQARAGLPPVALEVAEQQARSIPEGWERDAVLGELAIVRARVGQLEQALELAALPLLGGVRAHARAAIFAELLAAPGGGPAALEEICCREMPEWVRQELRTAAARALAGAQGPSRAGA